MHNESLKDKVVDGTAEEVNLNGDQPENKKKMMLSVEIPASYLVAGAALIGGIVIGRKLYLRPLVAKSAEKIQDVAEQAEEAAARG